MSTYLELAEREGVEVVAGGALGEGCFARPTILAGVDPGSALVREGIFGPVLVIDRETAGAEPHVPFGGIKGSSSMSREQGTAARRFFTTTMTVYLRVPGH